MTKVKGKIKILGLVDSSGSSFHRVILVLQALHDQKMTINGEEYTIEISLKHTSSQEKQFSEEDIINNDVIYYNWLILNNASELAALCKQYNTKLVYDIDDSPDLPIDHPNRTTKGIREFYPYLKPSIISHICNSDMTLTTGNELLSEISPYSSFAGVSENFIKVGQGQFILKPTERNKEEKTVLGIFCSISHYPDIKAFKSIWNKITKDSEIKQKCRLKLIGYVEGDKKWENIKNIFCVNNFEVEIVNAIPVDSYMDSLNTVDTCIAPLEDNDFNSKKSFLKLIECSIKGIPVLSSEVYSRKEKINAYIVCKEKIDYFKAIKTLIQKDSEGNYEFEKVGKYLSETNLANNDFDYRIEKIKAGIEYILTHPYTLDHNLKVFGIVYNDSQFTEYEKYDNSHIRTLEQKSWRFESNPIIDIVSNESNRGFSSSDYIGILSHKFNSKSGISAKMLDKIFKQVKNEDFDIINFSRQHWIDGKEYMNFSEGEHPGLTKILKLCINNLNATYIENPPVFYSNYFLAKSEIYKDYVNNWLIPTLNYMENDIWELVNGDSTYKSGLNSEELMKYTGMSHYNFSAFVCERLVGQYAMNKNLKIKIIG